jgi:hypothetical protein
VSQVTVKSGDTETVVELKDPAIAAFLAWLVPGAGHLYQGRTTKGLLFMICILGTFFYGLVLGDGKVVYASWRPADKRLPYLCQVGAGLPALPALVEAYRARHDKQPLFGGMMVPPKLPEDNNGEDELAVWHKRLSRDFELGTVFTMIAGLLNILVIYDAWGGPMQYADDKKHKDKKDDPQNSDEKPPGS